MNLDLAEYLAARRGCPVCVGWWRRALALGLTLAAVAGLALAWHRGGRG